MAHNLYLLAPVLIVFEIYCRYLSITGNNYLP